LPRVDHIKRAQKAQGACESCRKPIEVGQPYKAVKKRYGPRRVRHEACPTWKPSELSGSKMAEVMAVQEAYEPPYDSPTDWAEAVRAIAEAARQVGEQYQESADNIEQGFQHSTSMSENLASFAEELSSWADELESAADEIAELEPLAEHPCSGPDDEGCALEEDAHHEFDDGAGDEPIEVKRLGDLACASCGKTADDEESGHHDFMENSWRDQAEELAEVTSNEPTPGF